MHFFGRIYDQILLVLDGGVVVSRSIWPDIRSNFAMVVLWCRDQFGRIYDQILLVLDGGVMVS